MPKSRGRNSQKLPTSVDAAIGKAIRDRREANGLTQRDLASVVGVTYQQIQSYENGLIRVSASRLIAIAQQLATSPEALMGIERVQANSDLSLLNCIDAKGLRLLRAYNRLPSRDMQIKMVRFVEALAEFGPSNFKTAP